MGVHKRSPLTNYFYTISRYLFGYCSCYLNIYRGLNEDDRFYLLEDTILELNEPF